MHGCAVWLGSILVAKANVGRIRVKLSVVVGPLSAI